MPKKGRMPDPKVISDAFASFETRTLAKVGIALLKAAGAYDDEFEEDE
jgi:hypothetical protein